jgi:hypothetical protein
LTVLARLTPALAGATSWLGRQRHRTPPKQAGRSNALANSGKLWPLPAKLFSDVRQSGACGGLIDVRQSGAGGGLIDVRQLSACVGSVDVCQLNSILSTQPDPSKKNKTMPNTTIRNKIGRQRKLRNSKKRICLNMLPIFHLPFAWVWKEVDGLTGKFLHKPLTRPVQSGNSLVSFSRIRQVYF